MDNKTTLRSFMNANTIDLRLFFSIALELVELIRRQHQSNIILQNVNPNHIYIQFQGEQPSLQLIDSFLQEDDPIRTFAYISPEQTGRLKQKIDQRSDLYSVGILFYELLTGEAPFKTQTASELIHAHMALLPVPPRTVNHAIPQALSELVMKLLSKTAERRYHSAYGLLGDLRKCLDQLEGKGIIEPFPLGEIDEISRFRLPEKLYGRENELRDLLDAYDRSGSGPVELILIGGHAGSGKTTLIKAFQMTMMDKKGYFISGKFEQLNQSVPYAALIIAFRNLIRQILAENAEQIAEWKKRLLAAMGQSGVVITEVISELILIIGEQPPVEDLPPAESTNRFQTLFSSFMKVFADKNHPLVLSLDDLQWADPASLQLLQVLIHDPSNKYLLVIGTYRNNEIQEGHLLEKMFLGSLQGMGTGTQMITIEALGYPNVLQYVADVLHADPNRIEPLAKVLYRKTAGNPFYVKQMLQFIYDEKWLFFNPDKASWDWNMKAIMEREGFKDVISLIERRFNTLPEETRQVLRLAGCIGNTFDIKMLSMLYEQEPTDMEQALLPALSEGLILSEQDKYMFLHDRVQKAAYDLIPDEEKKKVHLKIGRSMLRFFDSETTDDHLFEAVHHLNMGSEFITDRVEIEQLVRLNLQSGRKAKASAAYVQALELLENGIRLVGDEGRSRYYDLYYKLLIEISECQYFFGDFDQAEAELDRLLLHVKSVEDRARIYVIQIAMYAFQKKEGKAGEIALRAMAEFGLHIPPKFSRLSILAEIAYTQLWLARKQRHLKDLPMSQSPSHKALADIVMVSSSILFIVNEELAVLLFAKYVRMSLKQGHSEAFSIALGSYAITLAFGLKGYRTALRLAQVAVDYSEKAGSTLLKGKVQLIMALILQFIQPQQLDRYYQKAVRLSLEGGDLVYAGYAISSHLIIAAGEDLRHLNHLCKTYPKIAARALDEMTLRVLHQTMQYVSLLQSTSDSKHLTKGSGHFDEGRLLLEDISNKEHKGNQLYYCTCKLEVYFLYARYSEALAVAEESKNLYAGAAMLLPIKQRNTFYHALAIMAEYPGASKSARRAFRKDLKALLSRMRRWARIVPDSTLSKYKMMLAEWARLNQDHMKAAKLYDQAIHCAQEAGYPRDEAIANELAAQYYLSMGKDNTAEVYLRNACKAYFRWGASAKVASLQERYPDLTSLSLIEQDEPKDFDADNSVKEEAAVMDKKLHEGLGYELDMDTIRQASKIVSKGSSEAELLENFLDLAIHNAGAESGVVLLGREDDLVIEARKDINRDRGKPDEGGDHFSAAIVQFVMRTRESVVLGEARQSIFASDPYIRRKRPRSILCLPIRYPDNRDGALYLENNLTSDAFTRERLEVLETVFSRMVYMKLWQTQQSAEEEAKPVKVKITPSLIESLTNREIEIVRLMAEGLSNKRIALRLEITEGTVKSHSVNIYGKLQVKNRVQAISRARELQLLN